MIISIIFVIILVLLASITGGYFLGVTLKDKIIATFLLLLLFFLLTLIISGIIFSGILIKDIVLDVLFRRGIN